MKRESVVDNMKKVIDRFSELIIRGNSLISAVPEKKHITSTACYTDFDKFSRAECKRWEMDCKHLLKVIYGEDSEHFYEFVESFHPKLHEKYSQEAIANATAVLTSAKEQVESGLLYKIEDLVAADFFDSVIEQSKELLKKGFKDPAAILGRVVIERTFKSICKKNDIEFSKDNTASILNDNLKKGGVFTQSQWRLIQSYIDIGNNAAHGKFDQYSKEDVNKMLEYIENHLLAK